MVWQYVRRQDREHWVTSQELVTALLGQADTLEQSLDTGWLLRHQPQTDALLRCMVVNQVLLSRALAELLTLVDAAGEDDS